MATPAAAAKASAGASVAAPKTSRLLLVILLALVFLVAGIAGTWWFLGQARGDDEDAPARTAVFLPLEQFTVNLQPQDGQQYLQTAMTLKVIDQSVADTIKAQMPEVRSRLLFLLSSKKPSELNTVEGKNQVIEEIIREVEAVLPPAKGKARAKKRSAEAKSAKKGKKARATEEAEEDEEEEPSRVLAVFFTHFIIQ